MTSHVRTEVVRTGRDRLDQTKTGQDRYEQEKETLNFLNKPSFVNFGLTLVTLS